MPTQIVMNLDSPEGITYDQKNSKLFWTDFDDGAIFTSLSDGSMSSKLIRARESILQFIKTANPQDEFFVIGFNDRPELIEDFTNSVEDIQARLATVRAGQAS